MELTDNGYIGQYKGCDVRVFEDIYYACLRVSMTTPFEPRFYATMRTDRLEWEEHKEALLGNLYGQLMRREEEHMQIPEPPRPLRFNVDFAQYIDDRRMQQFTRELEHLLMNGDISHHEAEFRLTRFRAQAEQERYEREVNGWWGTAPEKTKIYVDNHHIIEILNDKNVWVTPRFTGEKTYRARLYPKLNVVEDENGKWKKAKMAFFKFAKASVTSLNPAIEFKDQAFEGYKALDTFTYLKHEELKDYVKDYTNRPMAGDIIEK